MDQIVEPEGGAESEPTPKVKGINWWAEILDIWDRPIPLEDKNPNAGNMTLRFCVVEALGGGYQNEEKVSGMDRTARWALAVRIKDLVPGKPLKLKAEDIKLIKDVVNLRWPQSFIVGQIFKLIDPGER